MTEPERAASVVYRMPARTVDATRVPGLIEMERDYYPGGQLGLQGDWLVVTTWEGEVAFYPSASVVRAWVE